MKKAWLITWEWHGEDNRKENKIASILNYRHSGKRVAEYMERFYVDAEFSLIERLSYAKNKKNTPYPTQFDRLERDGRVALWEGRMHCGHNPFLYGRLVQNVRVEVDSDDNEKLEWDEIPRP